MEHTWPPNRRLVYDVKHLAYRHPVCFLLVLQHCFRSMADEKPRTFRDQNTHTTLQCVCHTTFCLYVLWNNHVRMVYTLQLGLSRSWIGPWSEVTWNENGSSSPHLFLVKISWISGYFFLHCKKEILTCIQTSIDPSWCHAILFVLARQMVTKW